MLKAKQRNLVLQTDSYKFTHWKQYPPGTEFVYSYLESRGGMFEKTLFFGLQYYLLEYLCGEVVNEQDVREARVFVDRHIGPGLFNFEGWMHIVNQHGGRLPVIIKAVPEGTLVDVHNVLTTIENTDPRCYWLPNYLETLLLKIWYPITVATLSNAIRKVFLNALERSGDPSLIDFKLHDFGYRGVSSEETAGVGAAAHLINFKGTDTVAGIRLLQQFYGSNEMEGFSIPAAEHSTITAWGPQNEAQAYRNMLTQFPDGLVAVVSDSYNVYYACEKLWGEMLRQQVLDRNGVLVVRPDSGNPKEAVLKVLEILGAKFGSQINSKGYRLLHPKVRVIQGDGVNYWTIQDTLSAINRAGWSVDNLTFGMGGALLQQLNRDTQKFAFKCSSIIVNGKEHDVFKDPVDGHDKASKRGRLALHFPQGKWATERSVRDAPDAEDHLQIVFRDGALVKNQTAAEIRERARK
ncbi:MAG TPA: nicotinate phosphoribosyltransferase [Candidatus Angelobacter sp.]|jgi:nicotinamide phosphoribosyltransferase|nr:nicotinate phosphoribosyltransferase [Candidatus Angelobacter sp.]